MLLEPLLKFLIWKLFFFFIWSCFFKVPTLFGVTSQMYFLLSFCNKRSSVAFYISGCLALDPTSAEIRVKQSHNETIQTHTGCRQTTKNLPSLRIWLNFRAVVGSSSAGLCSRLLFVPRWFYLFFESDYNKVRWNRARFVVEVCCHWCYSTSSAATLETFGCLALYNKIKSNKAAHLIKYQSSFVWGKLSTSVGLCRPRKL